MIKLKKNLVLTGMMGVGKTTIGKKLAERISYEFVDIDKLIESKEGFSITQIFKNKGESYFRKIENETTLKQLKRDSLIISLGGGAFLNRSIRRAVKKKSVSFWLDVEVNELIKRLKKTRKRPMLLKKNLDVTVKKIYLNRKKTYNEADHRIKCTSISPEKVINTIIELYEKSTD